MHQTKKGNQWYHRSAEGFAYGMKVHIGVDKGTGLIHSMETTATNVHDLTPAADLLHGEEKVVYADAGYQGIEKRAEWKAGASAFGLPGAQESVAFYPAGGHSVSSAFKRPDSAACSRIAAR